MLNENYNNINVINKIRQFNTPLNVNWLQQTHVNNAIELSSQYAHICQQHKQEKKWVLFINPEESSIEQLAKTHDIDVTKILMVNYKATDKNRAKVELTQIQSVLSKGNCAAVILSNNVFEAQEIKQLEQAASIGKTHCFVLEQNKLH